MTLDERELRDTFQEIADSTPIPDRWDEIVAAASRTDRRRTVTRATGGVLAIAAVVVVATLVVSSLRTDPFKVTVGTPQQGETVEFDGGPTVALGQLSRGKLAFVSDSNLYVADADAGTARRLTEEGDANALEWSADGEWLAFSVRDAPGYEDYTTWIARADGSDARALKGMNDTFAWSPTGHDLAILGDCCDPATAGDLYVVDPEGEQRQILDVATEIRTVAWAPDGKTLGFSRLFSDDFDVNTGTPNAGTMGGAFNAWTVGVDGANAQLLSAGALAAWSPAGTSVLVADGDEIVLVRVADGARRLIASGLVDPRDSDSWASFSPDGRSLALVVRPRDELDDKIVVCTDAGSACRTRSAGGGAGEVESDLDDYDSEWASDPRFSPDGERVVYVHSISRCSATGPECPSQSELRELTLANGRVRTLVDPDEPEISVTVHGWLTDGTILYQRETELRATDPATGAVFAIAGPIGFSGDGPEGQGEPGGATTAQWQLETNVGG